MWKKKIFDALYSLNFIFDFTEIYLPYNKLKEWSSLEFNMIINLSGFIHNKIYMVFTSQIMYFTIPNVNLSTK
jgi:hypothetical protein